MPKLRTDIDKIFFSIGEVAKKYNVNVSLIRFWEKEFDILKPKKKKGNRMFTKKDMYNLDVIYHLVKEEDLLWKELKRN